MIIISSLENNIKNYKKVLNYNPTYIHKIIRSLKMMTDDDDEMIL